MKTIETFKKVIILGVIILGFGATSFAQLTPPQNGPTEVTSSAQIKANIVTSTSFTNFLPLDFGTIYRAAGVKVAGTVTVIPDATFLTTFKEVTLGTGAGQTGSSASFEIQGDPGSIHVLTVPILPIFIAGPGNDKMSVTLDYSKVGTLPLLGTQISITIPPSGKYNFYVGGTLEISNVQTIGAYLNSGDMFFTLNY